MTQRCNATGSVAAHPHAKQGRGRMGVPPVLLLNVDTFTKFGGMRVQEGGRVDNTASKFVGRSVSCRGTRLQPALASCN